MKLVPILLLALLASAPSVRAAQIVSFDDGRTLRVAHLEFRDGAARLALESGGEIAVPAESVIAVEAATDVSDAMESAVAEPVPVETVAALAESLRSDERWREAAGRYAELLAAAADRHSIDRALLAAVAKVESNFNPFAVSRMGACGILQLMPATARRFGVRNVFDPSENIEGGARYLRWLIDRFDGRTDLALAGYNAGEGAVDRHRGIPPYRETVGYVRKVLGKAIEGRSQEP
jgi:soluble lytic murein transglycosylase-like protein